MQDEFIFINENLNKKKIYPLIFLVSLEPITFKESAHNQITKIIFKNLQDSKFSLHFTIFRTLNKKAFEITFALQSIDKKIFPVMITDIYKSITDDKIKHLIYYPFSLFNPFKKAILTFENKPYTIKEFNPIMKQWRESLKEL